jgi:rhamnosyltransferase
MKKRICLLAGFDRKNTMQDYVLYLARKLSKLSDVYYLADGKFSDIQLSKIRPFVKFAASVPHRTYDFGSWQILINHIGWEKIMTYDEMIICNDSIYGPMSNMQDIFDYMDLRDYDFWGLTENYNSNYHLDSYFMVFKNDILKHPKFHEFWKEIIPTSNRKTYESILTPFLTELGFTGNSYIKNYKKEDQLAYPIRLFRTNRMPFIRINSLKEPEHNLKEPILYIDSRIENETGYDASLIKNHLKSDDSFQGFGLKYYAHKTTRTLKNKIQNWHLKI